MRHLLLQCWSRQQTKPRTCDRLAVYETPASHSQFRPDNEQFDKDQLSTDRRAIDMYVIVKNLWEQTHVCKNPYRELPVRVSNTWWDSVLNHQSDILGRGSIVVSISEICDTHCHCRNLQTKVSGRQIQLFNLGAGFSTTPGWSWVRATLWASSLPPGRSWMVMRSLSQQSSVLKVSFFAAMLVSNENSWCAQCKPVFILYSSPMSMVTSFEKWFWSRTLSVSLCFVWLIIRVTSLFSIRWFTRCVRTKYQLDYFPMSWNSKKCI